MLVLLLLLLLLVFTVASTRLLCSALPFLFRSFITSY